MLTARGQYRGTVYEGGGGFELLAGGDWRAMIGRGAVASGELN